MKLSGISPEISERSTVSSFRLCQAQNITDFLLLSILNCTTQLFPQQSYRIGNTGVAASVPQRPAAAGVRGRRLGGKRGVLWQSEDSYAGKGENKRQENLVNGIVIA
jgi:hypothetical protein